MMLTIGTALAIPTSLLAAECLYPDRKLSDMNQPQLQMLISEMKDTGRLLLSRLTQEGRKKK